MSAIVERHHGFMGDGFQMWIFRNSLELTSGTIHVVKDIVMTECKTGEMRPGPSMTLSQEGAVRLMDSLWQAGVRPSATTALDSDVRLAYNKVISAKDDHIADLRVILHNRFAIEEAR